MRYQFTFPAATSDFVSASQLTSSSRRAACASSGITYTYHRCQALGGFTEASSVKAPLSPRELECLKWVLDGKSDTDIGEILGISPNTVHFHVERVKKT